MPKDKKYDTAATLKTLKEVQKKMHASKKRHGVTGPSRKKLGVKETTSSGQKVKDKKKLSWLERLTKGVKKHFQGQTEAAKKQLSPAEQKKLNRRRRGENK